VTTAPARQILWQGVPASAQHMQRPAHSGPHCAGSIVINSSPLSPPATSTSRWAVSGAMNKSIFFALVLLTSGSAMVARAADDCDNRCVSVASERIPKRAEIISVETSKPSNELLTRHIGT
jgi:hypothetical protein